jgi:hypothetical protein
MINILRDKPSNNYCKRRDKKSSIKRRLSKQRKAGSEREEEKEKRFPRYKCFIIYIF